MKDSGCGFIRRVVFPARVQGTIPSGTRPSTMFNPTVSRTRTESTRTERIAFLSLPVALFPCCFHRSAESSVRCVVPLRRLFNMLEGSPTRRAESTTRTPLCARSRYPPRSVKPTLLEISRFSLGRQHPSLTGGFVRNLSFEEPTRRRLSTYLFR